MPNTPEIHQYNREADMTDEERYYVEMRSTYEQKYIDLINVVVSQLPCGTHLTIRFPDGHEHLWRI